MTPQERKLIDELFDRLASLERAPRDPDAVDAINEGLERAPNALYPLVQTALVQDEALKRADARIRELEQELGIEQPQASQQGGFLDSMRDALSGRREQQGSVPTVRQGAPGTPGSPWRNTTGRQESYAEPTRYPEQAQAGGLFGGGGSFLGTAAATAAGVVGGALLMNSFRNMFGGHGQSHSAFDAGGGSGAPWGQSQSGGTLARDAGIDDIGSGGRTAAYDNQGGSDRAGLFDVAQNEDGDSDYDDGDDGFDSGDGGDTA